MLTDKRRVWYLDVPLTASHRLRQALNDAKAPGGVPTNLLRQSDLPVVAATVKLYFLELENPPLPYVQYEDLKALYKDSEKTATDDAKVAALKELLLRVPRINLLVIDALVTHLKGLMESTRGEEVDSDEAYLTKLGLSIGRCMCGSLSRRLDSDPLYRPRPTQDGHLADSYRPSTFALPV